MDIGLRFVVEKGITTAHAAVTGATAGKKGGKAEVWVIFSIDGKAKNPVITEKGLASLELKGLKPGTHTVEAEIVGDGATDHGTVTIKPRTVGWAGGFFMALYWALVLWYGYPAYTVTALVITMAVLAVRALIDDAEFWEAFLGQLGNNNWVLRTASVMMLVIPFLWWMDPTTSEMTLNPLKWIWNAGKELVNPTLEDPLGENGFWAAINSFFFGVKTMGWGVLAFHLWATFWAILVSRWDEVRDGLKKTGAEKSSGGLGKIFGNHVIGEALEIPFKILAIPFKTLFNK